MPTHSIYNLLIQLCWGALMLLWSVWRGGPWQNFTSFFCLLVSYVGLASFDLSTKTISFLQVLFGMGLAMISINDPNKVWLCSLLISMFGAGCFACSRKSEVIIGIFEKNKKLLTTLAVVGSIMIYIVLIFVATPRNGVRAWLSIGKVSIQLTEIQKFLSAFLTGLILEEYKKNDFKKLALTLGTILFHVICLVICSELGTAVVILLSNLIVLFLSVSGKYRAKLLMVIGTCSICLVSGYILAVNYTAMLPENLANIILKVQTRIGVFLDPSQDRFGKGFQAYMSLSTIGAAGLFGIPLEKMAGINFPNLKNDYVFTSLVLHGGLICGVTYFVSLISFVYTLLRESTSKHNKIAIAMILPILIQTIVGVLGSLNIIPFSGVGVPFISTGYSAYSMMLISILTVLILNSDKRLIKDISMNAISKLSGITMTIGVILVLVVSGAMSTHIGSEKATVMDEALTRKISVPATVLDANGYIISTSDEQNNTTMVSHPSAYSWLVGYSNKIYGSSGLYSTFERYMLNKNSETVEMHLFIDGGLQEYCYSLLDGLSGSITVLENKTGRILCLASRDARLNYDINNLSSTLAKANELEGFLLANGFTENEAPGSVFKVITSVAALQSEYAKENDLVYYDTGEYVNRSYYKVHNFGNSSYGNVDLEKALIKSVNTYFAFLADHIGARQLRETAEQFGFNKEIRTDFTTMHPSIEIKSINDLTSSGFGQGKIQTCPLHIAMIGAALASDDGSMHIPYVVDKISNNGKTLYLGKEQTIVNSVCSNEIREELLDHLQKVSVSYGIANENEEVYSKTGTAQLGNGLNHSYLMTFDETHTIVFSSNDTTQTGGTLFIEKAKELRFYMKSFM